jgi:hypothetical protein
MIVELSETLLRLLYKPIEKFDRALHGSAEVV